MPANYPNSNTSTKTMVFMSEHFQKLYEFFQTQTLCDITLLCDDKEQILAHKVILASASPMLLAMFDGGFKERNETSIPIKGIESGILKSIITCAYTFQLDIHQNNLEKLVRASDYFQFNYAKDLCYNFVKKNINADNCVNFMRCAEPLTQKGLYTYSFLYCLDNFEKILENESQCEKLYELDLEDIIKIISNDNLMVEIEKKIFDFIMGWIKYDINERSKYLLNLLNYLRLPLISTKDFEQICDEPLLNIETKCLIDLMKKKLFVEVDENIIKATTRTPNLYKPNIIFAIKSHSNESDLYVMYMDLRREEDLNWKTCDYSFFCPPREGATLAVSDTGILLAIGGYNYLKEWTNCVDELDLTSTLKKWIPTTPLRKIRKRFSTSVQGKYVYVVGGVDLLGTVLNSVEYYDTSLKVWYEIEKPLPTARYSCSSIIHNFCLYVFGGENDRKYFDTVDCYDLQDKCWTQCRPSYSHSLMAITNKENYLYLFGGYPLLSFVGYKMNLENFKWDVLPVMINSKVFANAVTIGNDLFVVGKNKSWGYEEIGRTPDGVYCERYITEKDTWQVINSSSILSDYDHIICLNDERLKTFNIGL